MLLAFVAAIDIQGGKRYCKISLKAVEACASSAGDLPSVFLEFNIKRQIETRGLNKGGYDEEDGKFIGVPGHLAPAVSGPITVQSAWSKVASKQWTETLLAVYIRPKSAAKSLMGLTVMDLRNLAIQGAYHRLFVTRF